jgi:hypothetical protein
LKATNGEGKLPRNRSVRHSTAAFTVSKATNELTNKLTYLLHGAESFLRS